MRIVIVALLGVLAGCTSSQKLTAPWVGAGTGPSAGLNRAYAACQAAYERSTNPTRTNRAKCLTAAENRFASDFPDREYLRQQQGLRMSLAQRVDSGEITQAVADATYAREMSRIKAASEARRAAG